MQGDGKGFKVYSAEVEAFSRMFLFLAAGSVRHVRFSY
jgi:hypothetical protein